MVIPTTFTSCRAFLTASRRCGLMMASTFFILVSLSVQGEFQNQPQRHRDTEDKNDEMTAQPFRFLSLCLCGSVANRNTSQCAARAAAAGGERFSLSAGS